MIVSVDLPSPVADALAREAAISGLSAAQWLTDRLADRFGFPHRVGQSLLTSNSGTDRIETTEKHV